MKTKLLILTALPLALVAAGCGKNQSKDKSQPVTNSPAATETGASGAVAPKGAMASPVINSVETNAAAATNQPGPNASATASP